MAASIGYWWMQVGAIILCLNQRNENVIKKQITLSFPLSDICLPIQNTNSQEYDGLGNLLMWVHVFDSVRFGEVIVLK